MLDSLNLKFHNFEDCFNNHYSIEEIKTIGTFNPKIWSKTFGKSLTQNITEAKILHTYTGLELPLKRHSASQKMQVLEIAGLQTYNEKSELKKFFIKENSHILKKCFISRIDICIDFEKIPPQVLRKLNSKRRKKKYKNTTYWKTNSENKSNSKLDIKIYDKAKKENLNCPLYRLEFCFRSPYFKNLKLLDLEEELFKLEKTIYRFCGLKVKIQAL